MMCLMSSYYLVETNNGYNIVYYMVGKLGSYKDNDVSGLGVHWPLDRDGGCDCRLDTERRI
jgi:hypothetical protein